MGHSGRKTGKGLRIVFVVTLLAGAAEAAPKPKIVNGVGSHGHPTTAALLYSQGGAISDDNAGAWCSATLIGCRTVLTAAHCVELDTQPGHYRVYLQHAGIFTVQSIAMHPSYSFPISDIATLKLAEEVTGIAPTSVASIDPSLSIPHSGTIVGFGQTSGTGNDYAIKRAGKVVTTNCDPAQAGGGDDELVCWTYSNPVGAPGEDSNTCNGDSGGPLFMDLGAGEEVVGVTSGGTTESCLQGDHAYDASVFRNRSFILAQLGNDTTTACGGHGAVGDPTVDVLGYDATLSATNPFEDIVLPVDPDVTRLRVAVNGEDNGSFDVDLYLAATGTAGPSNFDCRADGQSVFGACEILAPAAGNWSVSVRRIQGAGEFQLTVTRFRSVSGETTPTPTPVIPGETPTPTEIPPTALPTATLPPADSCSGSCGGNAGSCWCDELCTDFGDCCTDYAEQCLATPPSPTATPAPPTATFTATFTPTATATSTPTATDTPSLPATPTATSPPTGATCAGACGGNAGSCWCDEACVELGDCCADYASECTTPAPPTDSCVGSCGGNAGSCWCDDACIDFGDCCTDYTAACG